MAGSAEIALKRALTFERFLKVLGMENLQAPSTKADPIETEAFYLEILEAMASRLVVLEALAKRADGHSEMLAALSERVVSIERGCAKSEKSIDALAEAVNVLSSNREPKATEQPEEQPAEQPEAD